MAEVLDWWDESERDDPKPNLESIAQGHFRIVEVGWSRRTDVFYLKFNTSDHQPAMSSADRDILWRFDPNSGDVLGAEIEHFSRHFIKDHEGFRDIWEKTLPRGYDVEGFKLRLTASDTSVNTAQPLYERVAELAAA